MLQANGLVERQNRTIKEKLLKILSEDHKEEWVSALDGVLFAHRTAKHRSTGFSPFRLLYGREPKLPIDVTLCPGEMASSDEFSEAYVKHVSEVMFSIRQATNATAHNAIQNAQLQQRVAYNKRHKSSITFQVDDQVLLRNLKRIDRKGGKIEFALAWSLYDSRDIQ